MPTSHFSLSFPNSPSITSLSLYFPSFCLSLLSLFSLFLSLSLFCLLFTFLLCFISLSLLYLDYTPIIPSPPLSLISFISLSFYISLSLSYPLLQFLCLFLSVNVPVFFYIYQLNYLLVSFYIGHLYLSL